jgi:quercetin dioxygenase-like cupin family protein
VERLSFRAADARRLTDDRLVDVSVAPLTEPIARGAGFQVAIFRIGPGGRIARHPAVVPQLLAVLEGGGRVSGGDAVEVAVAAGDAVVWEAGEEHETVSEQGMTALIVEGEGLVPAHRR